jgi:Rieske Fe-S protein
MTGEADPDRGRRRFLDWLLGSSIGALLVAIGYPIVQFLRPPEQREQSAGVVEVGPTDAPKLVKDGFQLVRVGDEPVIVIRVAPTDVRAFSAVCTHLGCLVTFQQERERLFCPCHNGVFDLNGRVVSGPPPEPLQKYDVNLVPGPAAAKTIVVSRRR